MKSLPLLLAAALSAIFSIPSSRVIAEDSGAFTPLFNGENLNGWHGRPHFSPIALAAMPEEERAAKLAAWQADAAKHWSVENGELVNDGRGAYLVTNKDYRDFELHLQYIRDFTPAVETDTRRATVICRLNR